MADSSQLIQLSKETLKLIEEYEKRFSKGTIFSGILTVFQTEAPKAAGYIVEHTLSGQLLKRRSGELARGLQGLAAMTNGVPSIRMGVFQGPAQAYYGIQEEGTNDLDPASPFEPIRPRNAKALAVPVDSLDGGRAEYPSPRDYPGSLKFVPYRRGIAIGALYDEEELKAGRAAGLSLRDIKAAYLLLTQVSIKGKHYMYTGMTQYLPFLAQALLDYLTDHFKP